MSTLVPRLYEICNVSPLPGLCVAVFRAPRFEVDMDAIGASDSEGFATGQAISVRAWQ